MLKIWVEVGVERTLVLGDGGEVRLLVACVVVGDTVCCDSDHVDDSALEVVISLVLVGVPRDAGVDGDIVILVFEGGTVSVTD